MGNYNTRKPAAIKPTATDSLSIYSFRYTVDYLDMQNKERPAQACILRKEITNYGRVWGKNKVTQLYKYLNEETKSVVTGRIKRFIVTGCKPKVCEFLQADPYSGYLQIIQYRLQGSLFDFLKTVATLESLHLACNSYILEEFLEISKLDFPSLQELKFIARRNFGFHVLKRIISVMRNLKILYLEERYCCCLANMSAIEFYDLSAEDTTDEDPFICLQELHLTRICQFKEDISDLISQKLVNLVTLNMICCKIVSDAGLEFLSKLKKLENLDLSYCSGINDTGLNYIFQITSLKSLQLQKCNEITDRGFESIFLLRNLTRLILCFCSWMTDSTFKHLNELSSLQKLIIVSSSKVSDACFPHLAAGKLKLKALHLDQCYMITDKGISHICQGSLNLQVLSLRNCNITDRAVCHIVKGFPYLQYLDLTLCPYVTEKRVRLIKRKHPRIKLSYV